MADATTSLDSNRSMKAKENRVEIILRCSGSEWGTAREIANTVRRALEGSPVVRHFCISWEPDPVEELAEAPNPTIDP